MSKMLMCLAPWPRCHSVRLPSNQLGDSQEVKTELKTTEDVPQCPPKGEDKTIRKEGEELGLLVASRGAV